MTDVGHNMTEDLLLNLERKINKVYAQAAEEMQKKIEKQLEKYQQKLTIKQAEYDSGKISKKEFDTWKQNQIHIQNNTKALADTLTQDLVNHNKIATAMINGHTPSVYALNYNFGTYQIESDIKASTSFSLYNHFTVENLIRDNPQILPEWKIDEKKDYIWNYKKVNSALTQGILQGESIPKIAERFRTGLCTQNKNLMTTFARTATTGAQSSGRVDAYKRAKDMGINVKQKWLATLDGRTRHTHRLMDGQTIAMGDKFDNGCRFPGDPTGPAHEVYNCRCTLVPVIKGFERDDSWKNNVVNYEEWEKGGSGFAHWLEEQADPDAAIMAAWSGKKYSFVYNLMKNSDAPGHGADANNFFNALKKLGQDSGIGSPPKVWNAYMTGQLDAEDLKKFEDIIKKYLPQQVDNIADTAKVTGTVKNEVFGIDLNKPHFENFSDEFKKAIPDLADRIEKGDFPKPSEIHALAKNIKTDQDELLIDLLFNHQSYVQTYHGFSDEVKKQYAEIFSVLKKQSKTTLWRGESGDWIKQYGEFKPGKEITFDSMSFTTPDKKFMQSHYDVIFEFEKGTPYINTVGQPWDDKLVLGKFKTVSVDTLPTGQKHVVLKYIDDATDTAKTIKAADNIADTTKISKEAQDQLDKLKLKAGNPMTKDEADTYKVNPLFDAADKTTTTNCQTCSFAYELRRQGYDVIALPKDDKLSDIFDLQKKLGQSQANGWTNKITGKPPKSLIHQDNINYFMTKQAFIEDLEKNVGKNGERYIMGVKWKGNGAHSICVDRDENGILRIIDNQRGPGEKNTWTAAEYFDEKNIANIRRLYRVDDCVPNAEYFNKIVVDANKIKMTMPAKISDLKPGEYAKVSKAAKAKGETPAMYYKKWKNGIIDDPDLDDIFNTANKAKTAAAAPKPTPAPVTKATAKTAVSADLDIDAFKNKSASAVWKELNANKAGGGKFWKDITDIGKANGMKPAEAWKKYLAGELDADDVKKIETHLAKIYKKADNTPSAVIPNDKIPGLKSYGEWKYLADDLFTIDDDLYDSLVAEMGKLKKQNGGKAFKDIFDEYKAGKIQSKELDDLFEKTIKTLNPKATTKGATKAVTKTDDIIKSVKKYGDDIAGVNVGDNVDDIMETLLDYIADDDLIEILENKTDDIKAYFAKYLKGKVSDPDLDDLFNVPKTATATKAATKATAVDMDLLKTKKVSNVWNELKDQGGTAYSQFWKTVGEVGKDYGLEKKQSKVWQMYIDGKLKPEESKKIDDFLLKHYFNKTATTVTKSDDIIKLKKKIDKIDKLVADVEKNPSQYKFAFHGKVQSFDDIAWNLSGTTEEKLNKLLAMGAKPTNTTQKIIDALDEKQKLKGQILSLQNSAKSVATKSDELIKAEAKLKKAEDELAKIPNPTYSGIWKDDVTLADYDAKKGVIKAKKIYYEDKIAEYEDKLNSGYFANEGGKAWAKSVIDKFKKHLDDLNDFETEGKKYAKAQKAVDKAKQEVIKHTPVGEAYTKERKDAALWVKPGGTSYKEADAYYDDLATKVHGAKTKAEHEGYYHYTWGSGPFNQALAGFDGSWSNPSPLGPGKFSIDKNGYGDKIRGLTSLCEKSKYDQDFWCQAGLDDVVFESFLGIKPGTLSKMTEAEAQQFLGVQNEIPQFVSTSINKGGGSYNPGTMTLNFYVPQGSEALYVREDGHFGKSEHEMILQRGGTYKVTRIYKAKGLHGSNEWIVDLEVHPEFGYDKFQQNK